MTTAPEHDPFGFLGLTYDDVLLLPGASDLNPTEIDGAIQDAAYAWLPSLLPEPDPVTPPASFSVLHRSAMGAYLLVYSWIMTDILELNAAIAGVKALDCPDDDPTHFVRSTQHWIGCVWELVPLEHERSAWVRHILRPSAPNLAAYLADRRPSGPAGNPTAITEISGQVL